MALLLNPYTFKFFINQYDDKIRYNLLWLCYWILTLSMFSLLLSNTINYNSQIAIPNHDFHHHQKRTIWLCKCIRKIVFVCWSGTTPFLSVFIHQYYHKINYQLSLISIDLQHTLNSKCARLWYWILTLSSFSFTNIIIK